MTHLSLSFSIEYVTPHFAIPSNIALIHSTDIIPAGQLRLPMPQGAAVLPCLFLVFIGLNCKVSLHTSDIDW